MSLRNSKLLPTSLTAFIAVAVIFSLAQSALGIQFYLGEQECFSQKVEDDGDIVRVSFVVIRRKSRLHASTASIDLVVKGPYGEQVHDDRDKKTEHFEFTAHRKGMYQFCFISKAGYVELVDFHIEVNHQEHLEPVKNEQLAGVKEQISKLQKWLKSIQFKMRWEIADQLRLEELNKEMNFWAITKAIVESAALVGSSILQVFLLKRLFKGKLGE